MELVLKLPKNKPPFIGVLFNYELEATTINQKWAEHFRGFTFQIILDPSQKLYITMVHKDHRSERYAVNYDPVTLLKFLQYTKEHKSFKFGHLILKDGKYVIPKTREQSEQLLFKIDEIKVQMLTVEN